MSTQRIEDIMRILDVETAPTQKTAAAAQTATPAAPPSGAMQAAMTDVMNSLNTGNTKTASEGSPEQDLVKMANEIVAIDREGEIKHAQLIGTAMADAFVSRVNQWEKAASALPSPNTKTAQDDSDQLAKFAQENPEVFNMAVNQGYTDAKALMDKVGEDLYARAYQAKTAAIHKTAAEHFLMGWIAMEQAERALAR